MITETVPEQAEYDAILSSSYFAGHTNSGRFLRYVCEKYFAGTHNITEFEIAVEALGRRPDFDPQQDSIVRVEAHRVRKRLRDYYEAEGQSHSLRLILPQGHYLPSFVPAAARAHSENHALDGSASMGSEVPAQLPPPLNYSSSRPFYIWSLAAALLLVTVAGLMFFLHNGKKTAPAAIAVTSATPLTAASPEVLILAGSSAQSYTDQLGHVWSADRYFNGGERWPVRPRRIARTDDPQLFLTARQGQDFGYDIPLKPGHYELRLYFAETFYGDDNSEGGGESSRIFDVKANGEPLLVNFDPLSDAGGSNTANVRVFAGISPAPDGKLHLRFTNRWLLKGVAFVNAIELVPTEGTTMLPVHWVAGSSAVEDKKGQLWTPDQYVKGGRKRQLQEEVLNTTDPELYQSERYGNFNYEIPVAGNSTYTLTLHFSEHWFGVPGYGAAGEGEGKRVFDVYCNGVYLLHDLDVYREAGGSLRALTKTFHGLIPNHQGKLQLSFVPNKDYAAVTAIEVAPESDRGYHRIDSAPKN